MLRVGKLHPGKRGRSARLVLDLWQPGAVADHRA